MLQEVLPVDFIKIKLGSLHVLEFEVSDGQMHIAFEELFGVVDEPEKGYFQALYGLAVLTVLEKVFPIPGELIIKRVNFLGLGGNFLEREGREQNARRQK
jgi:hypothetical protein